MLIFVVNIRPARTFWNSTHYLLSPLTLGWSWNLWHNPMWNMAVNNISYPIYLLSTRTEKGYITKMIPFFFCSVYDKFRKSTAKHKEHMQAPNGMGPDVWRSKSPLSACHTISKCSIGTSLIHDSYTTDMEQLIWHMTTKGWLTYVGRTEECQSKRCFVYMYTILSLPTT